MPGLKPGLVYTLAQTLPHRGDMRLLDEVVGYEAEAVRARVHVRAASAFCESDGVPAWVGLEYMAQAMAVFSGIELLQRGETPRIAFLVGTRRYESIVPSFAIGTTLDVTARLVLWEQDNLFAFDCAIFEGTRKLAWGEIKAFRPDDVQTYLTQASS